MDKQSKKKEQPSQQESQQPSLALQIVNRYFRWILLLVITTSVLIAYTTVIDTQVTEVQDVARDSLTAKEQTLSALKEIKTDLDLVVKEYGGMIERRKADLGRLDGLLPDASAYGDLYTIVDQITVRSGLSVTNMTISFDDESASRLHAGTTGAKPKTAATVKKMTLHISVEGGTYDSFKSYLENLERSIPLFDVQSLSFDGGAYIPNEEGETPAPHYDIELATYYQS
ncbi:MAG: hypothetical protein HY422_01735 [Candidatus Komeilibacteria bacterium]|nr:hypothetical protein [Candidatus Komeilibacteria bacterium]